MSTIDDKRKARTLTASNGQSLEGGGGELPSLAERIEEDKDILLDHFLNLIRKDGDVDELCRFLLHCGVNGDDVKRAGGSWGLAVLRHYLTLEGYDMEKAGRDLATFPPVAARIEELKDEDEHHKEVEAWERRERRRRASTTKSV
jgi:hypothetical protein